MKDKVHKTAQVTLCRYGNFALPVPLSLYIVAGARGSEKLMCLSCTDHMPTIHRAQDINSILASLAWFALYLMLIKAVGAPVAFLL